MSLLVMFGSFLLLVALGLLGGFVGYFLMGLLHRYDPPARVAEIREQLFGSNSLPVELRERLEENRQLIEARTGELIELRARAADREHGMVEIERRKVRAQASMDQLEVEVRVLAEACADHEEIIAELTPQLAAAAGTAVEHAGRSEMVRVALAEEDGRSVALERQVNVAEQDVIARDEELARLAAESERLKAKLTAQDRNAVDENDSGETDEDVRVRAERDAVLAELTAIDRENQAAVEELDAVQLGREAVAQQLVALNQERQDVSLNLDVASTKLDSIVRQRLDRTALADVIQLEINRLQHSIDLHESELRSITASNAGVDRKTVRVTQELQLAEQAARQEDEELQQSVGKEQALREQWQAATQNLPALRGELDEREREIAAAHRARQELEGVMARGEDVEQSRRDDLRLRKELAELVQRDSEGKQRIALLQHSLGELEDAVATAEGQLAGAEAQAQAVEREHAALQAQRDELDQAIAAHLRANQQSEVRIRAKQSEARKLAHRLRTRS